MIRTVRILTLIVAAALLMTPAGAEVSLRFSPADTTVGPGETGRLSVVLDAPDLDLLGFVVYVTYDTAVVRSLGGTMGDLFASSGLMVFDNFEYPEPGQWHGFAAIMGAGSYVTGPGELYAWDFEARAGGVCPIESVEVYVAAPDGSYYADVTLDPTTITVFDPISPAPTPVVVRPLLKTWPNPFNPRTAVTVEMPTAGRGRLSVVDVRGREVGVLHAGDLPPGPSTFTWNGRDDGGRSLPGGLYLFRLETERLTATTKGLLVK